MKNAGNRLKTWELALAISLCITLAHGIAFPAAGCHWWGVMYPELTAEAAAAPVWNGGGLPANGVVLRLRLLDRLAALRE